MWCKVYPTGRGMSTADREGGGGEPPGRMKTISALTLGCKVNQYDTAAMLRLFREAGYRIVPWGERSDIALVNTCTVTQTADKKSRAAIRQASRRGSAVCVCGCMAQRQKDALLALDGVCWVVGTAERGRVVELVESGSGRVAAGERPAFESLTLDGPAGRTRAFVKVQEGCAHFCAYCIIPYVRGRPHSRPRADVIDEVRRLAAAGVAEVVLTGIDLSSYESGGDLAELVAAIEETTPLSRLRLGSLEPGLFTEDFTRRLARSRILCPHFHLSLQSGSERILRRMNRRYTPDDFRREVETLRSAFTLPAIATDVMTGFPGEGETEFAQTLRFVREVGFSRLHVFPYSERQGTAAAALPEVVPPDQRRQRALALIAAGAELEQAYVRLVRGLPHSVLFEEEDAAGAAGYSERYVRVSAAGARPGTVGTVRAETQNGTCLYGRLETDPPAAC